jgi:lipid A 3-O-deacylase
MNGTIEGSGWKKAVIVMVLFGAGMTRVAAQESDQLPARRSFAAASLRDPGDPPARIALEVEAPPVNIWKSEIGSGFRKDTLHAGFSLGAGFGTKTFGSKLTHDLAISSSHFGRIVTETTAEHQWYRGNWEFLAELFGGPQFHPNLAYVVGVTPFARYNFATGTRWIPFFDAGAGLSATDIGLPDLSTTFEFNVQLGAGTHWFFQRNAAATVQYRWLHLSNASIQKPNPSVNSSIFLAGVTWFF